MFCKGVRAAVRPAWRQYGSESKFLNTSKYSSPNKTFRCIRRQAATSSSGDLNERLDNSSRAPSPSRRSGTPSSGSSLQQPKKQQQQRWHAPNDPKYERWVGKRATAASSSSTSSPTVYTSITCPPPPENPSKTWDDPVWASPADPARQVFCNRSLNMKSIKSVGFDMDYTLSQYKEETFEELAYNLTTQKLVENFGYPECVSEFAFDPNYVVRGLVIDKVRGNLLKMDRHKYVKIAYHGFEELSKEHKFNVYGNAKLRESFDGSDFANIDTLFSLGEAYLFCQLVELKDAAEAGSQLTEKTYWDLFTDVRCAVDMCHRDGSLKTEVAKDPAKYIHKDSSLLPMLRLLRDSGRSTFIVTNSMWDYTNIVMNFLLEEKTGTQIDHDWLRHFDVVITGSRKPGFFTDERAMLFEVDLASGLLHNTDSGSPLVQLDQAVKENVSHNPISPTGTTAGLLDGQDKPPTRVFQGGSYRDLHGFLNIESGSQVLYAGDHIFGDILRSKKTLGWRTLLIVPELESELRTLLRPDMRGKMGEFASLREQHESLDDSIQRMDWALTQEEAKFMSEEQRKELEMTLQDFTEQRDHIRQMHWTQLRKYHQTFHPIWGQVMLTGYQSSRFAHQVERFACLYTSHVGNFGAYSPDKRFRSKADSMPHFGNDVC